LKRNLIALSLAGVLAMFAYAIPVQDNAQAGQPSDNGQQQGEMGGHHRRGAWNGQQGMQHRLQMLTKQLNLNSDQQSKVQAILQNQQTQFASMHQDTSLSQQDRRTKMMQLHETTNSQIRAVLNDDQQKKFDAMVQKEHQRMGKHEHPGGEAAPQPQP
jgi:hypothetical protein